MHLIKTFPTLYALSSTQKIKQWTVSVFENDDGTSIIRKDHGQTGKKITENNRNIKKGKNIGKSNETTPVQQAMSEAESAINVKRYANYEFEIPDPNTYVPRVILPQLASPKKKGNIRFPCDMQPKLNGICNLTKRSLGYLELQQYFPAYIEWKGLKPPLSSIPQDITSYHSRGGHMFHTIEHLTPFLNGLMEVNDLVHGELYVHGWSLQKIGSYAKELKPDSHKLQYWIYDVADTSKSWAARWAKFMSNYNSMFNGYVDCPVKLCPTVQVDSYGEAKYYHDLWVSQGFEGGVLRNHHGMYLFEYRSKDLEKVKQYKNAEFVIVDGKEGTGNDEGCIIFKCSTEDGNEFDVRPRGTVEERQEYFKNLNNLIGEQLTVRYAELSDDNIPLQPVGIIPRDYE